MKIARVATGYIIFIWLLVVVLLGTVLFMGYLRSVADLEQLMESEAERLVEITLISSASI